MGKNQVRNTSQLNINGTTVSETAIFERRESTARSYCRKLPALFVKACGCHLYDSSGREYIDFLAGCSSLNYGHNEPDLKAALIDYIERDGMTHTLDMHCDAKAEFLLALEQHILQPRGLDYRVQFTGPTGTNAVEAAMKLARKVTGRRTIVSFTNGFHGVSAGALQATGARYHKAEGMSAPGEVARAPYDGYFGPHIDTADMLEQYLGDPSSGFDLPAAILVETVQGEGGLNTASAGWLKRIAEIAKQNGALLIVDDIQAGCGRSGTFFSFEKTGVVPDMVTMAKSLSGYGLPMAAVMIHPDHDVWQPAEHNGTFRGNAHAFVTAEKAIEKFWSTGRFAEDIVQRSEYLASRLNAMATTVPGARVVGRGMMQGVDVGTGELATEICGHAFSNGLVIETSGAFDQVVKILAPLNIEHADFDQGLSILEYAFAQANGRYAQAVG